MSTAVFSGALLLSQAACTGGDGDAGKDAFHSEVTTRALSGPKTTPTPGMGVDPYCALLQIADDPHPHHSCHPTACESCTNPYWASLCFLFDSVTPTVLEKYFGLGVGLAAEWGIMWASLLNVFAEHASAFACGGNSNLGMQKWETETCTQWGLDSKECKAARIAFTCTCMHDADARQGRKDTMLENCEFCACYKERKYVGGKDQLDGAMRCLNRPRPRIRSGRTFGDPNLSTFDGPRIADNRAGEFVAVRRAAGESGPSLAVHFRYSPWESSPMVSQVTAVALKYENTRIAVYAGNPPVLRVDGALVEIPEDGYFAGDAVDIYDLGGYYRVYLPNGDLVNVTNLGNLLNVSLELTDDLVGKAEGVLGNFDLNGGNEPHSWGTNDFRITSQADSLFDYAPGTTFATFDDPSFPSYSFDPGAVPMPAQVAALTTCSSLGIVDGDVLDGCVHDVLATDGAVDFLVAASAADIEAGGDAPVELAVANEGSESPPGGGSGGGWSSGSGAGSTGSTSGAGGWMPGGFGSGAGSTGSTSGAGGSGAGGWGSGSGAGSTGSTSGAGGSGAGGWGSGGGAGSTGSTSGAGGSGAGGWGSGSGAGSTGSTSGAGGSGAGGFGAGGWMPGGFGAGSP